MGQVQEQEHWRECKYKEHWRECSDVGWQGQEHWRECKCLKSSTSRAHNFLPPRTLSVAAVLVAARRSLSPSVRVVGSPVHGRCTTMVEQGASCGTMLQQWGSGQTARPSKNTAGNLRVSCAPPRALQKITWVGDLGAVLQVCALSSDQWGGASERSRALARATLLAWPRDIRANPMWVFALSSRLVCG